MNFFRYNRLPLYQAPDVNPGATPPAVDPAIAAAADPAAGDPPAAAAEPPASADPVEPGATVDPLNPDSPPKPVNNRGKAAPPKWALDRISEESGEKTRERELRLRTERERDEALALVESLRGGQNPPAAPRQNDNNVDVETRARQIATETLNNEKIGSVISAGLSKFPDWDQKAEMLGAVGAASPAFVLDVVSVDPANAHVLLHQLADDPDKAARLAKMDPRNRTIELVKMSMAANPQSAEPPKPAAPRRTVSNAPPPPPAIDPGSSPTIDWRSDKVSDSEFSKGWEENAAKRAAKRR